MGGPSMHRRFVAVLAGACAMSVACQLFALETGLCATGPYAVTCELVFKSLELPVRGNPWARSSNGRIQHTEIVLLFWQDQIDDGYQWEDLVSAREHALAVAAHRQRARVS